MGEERDPEVERITERCVEELNTMGCAIASGAEARCANYEIAIRARGGGR